MKGCFMVGSSLSTHAPNSILISVRRPACDGTFRRNLHIDCSLALCRLVALTSQSIFSTLSPLVLHHIINNESLLTRRFRVCICWFYVQD